VLLRGGGNSGIEPGRKVRLKPVNICLPPGTKARIQHHPTDPALIGQMCTVTNINAEQRRCLVRLSPDDATAAAAMPLEQPQEFIIAQAHLAPQPLPKRPRGAAIHPMAVNRKVKISARITPKEGPDGASLPAQTVTMVGEIAGYDHGSRCYLILTKRPSDGLMLPMSVPQHHCSPEDISLTGPAGGGVEQHSVGSGGGGGTLLDLPHIRERCLLYRCGQTSNERHCEACTCWICGKAPALCRRWHEHSAARSEEPAWQQARYLYWLKKAKQRGKAMQSRAAAAAAAAGGLALEASSGLSLEDAVEEDDQEDEALDLGPVQGGGGEEGHAGVGGGGDGYVDEERRRELEELFEEAEMVSGEAEAEDIFSPYEASGTTEGGPLFGALSHPDVVVEATSLSFVKPPQLDYAYTILSPQHPIVADVCLARGGLSDLQLELIGFAMMQTDRRLPKEQPHHHLGARAAFFNGDGAGVGKGRMVAGLILERFLQGGSTPQSDGKRAVWVSVSADLVEDAKRDLRDVGGFVDGAGTKGGVKIKVAALNKLGYDPIALGGSEKDRLQEGVLFVTYSGLIAKERTKGGKPGRTRMQQIKDWLGEGFKGRDAFIVFDECHKAKNLVPESGGAASKTGMAVLELQQSLPEARFCFCSATGVGAVKGMAYMTRLGLWGAGTGFQDPRPGGQDHFSQFLKEIAPTKRQSPAVMELIALEMKQRGMYLSRQLAFAGAEFEVCHVDLSPEQVGVYDGAARLWQLMLSCFDTASEVVRDKANHKVFWAAHQRFFRTLLMSLKVPETVRQCKKALDEGMCVVVGLQSTGESRLDEAFKAGLEVSSRVWFLTSNPTSPNLTPV